jgi:sulfur carrier protein ThiS
VNSATHRTGDLKRIESLLAIAIARVARTGTGGITRLTGDVLAGPGTGSQAATVVRVNGSTVPAGGALTTGNVLQVTGAAALGYAPVNLAGGANFVTGVLPAANQASQTMAGDVTGTTGANTVVALQNRPLSNAAPALADVIAWNGAGWAPAVPASGGITQLTGDVLAGPGVGSQAGTVVAVNGSTVPAGGALTTGNVLQVTGAAALGYAAVNLAGGANFVTGVLPAANQASQTMGGDVTGTTAASTVAKVNGSTVPAGGALTTGNVLQVTGAAALGYAAVNLAGGANFVTGVLPAANQASQTMGGDVTGTTAASTVAKVNGSTVPAGGALTTGNVLQVTGAAALGYAPVNLAGGANFVTGVLPAANQASQTMGGDVTGTTAASTVAKVNGSTVPAGGALTTGNVLQVTGAAALGYAAVNLAGGANFVTGVLPAANQASQAMGGDVTGTTAASTVAKVNGSTVPAGGALTTGNVLQVTGAAALGYAAVNLAGGAAHVTGVLPAANQASQTMGGDVTGTTAASTVVALQGNAVSSSAPTTAYPMIWSGSAWGPGGNIDFANKYAKNLQTATFDQELANGNSGAAFTINWTSAQKQTITLNANCTFTFTSPNGPCNMVLRLVQDAVGSRTVTWPATVKWVGAAAPTLTTSANAVDIVSLYWNGTNYYASYGLNFA